MHGAKPSHVIRLNCPRSGKDESRSDEGSDGEDFTKDSGDAMIDAASSRSSPPLPTPVDQLVGRDQEAAAAVELLTCANVRLLTLLGPGGVGKTRLALRVAQNASPLFPDGVAFVPLADLRDSDLLFSSVAQVLGLHGTDGRSLENLAHEHLASRHFLLVLDNVEQLLPGAAAHVAAFLAACPLLTVLVTSRALLRTSGEHAFPVLALSVPPETQTEIHALERYASVRLLVTRGQAQRPDFGLTADNAVAISHLCRQLEGIPLALELAAAWLRIFSPAALSHRFEYRLPLLIGGPADQPERHTTMRGTIAWSYDLLPASEQALFRCLSVFTGGSTLETAEAVIGAGAPLDVLTGVAALCDASLLQPIGAADSEPRFMMLEMIREYAHERFGEDSARETVERSHAAYYLALAEGLAKHLLGPAHGESFARLEREHGNLRSALSWTMDHEPAWALRLAGCLSAFWGNRGHLEEGQRWYERVLDRGGDAPPGARAVALFGYAWLVWSSGDNDLAERCAAESATLATEAGNPELVCWALYILGRTAGSQGKWALAAERLNDALDRCRQLGNRAGEAIMLHHLGVVAYRQGNWSRADSLLSEAVAFNRELGLTWGVAWTLNSLSLVARARGDARGAWTIYRESLSLLGDDDETYAAIPLAGMARLAAESGQLTIAARVATAVVERRQIIGVPVWEHAGPDLERALALARNGLRGAFEGARIDGAVLTLAAVIAEARAIPAPASLSAGTSDPDALTPREREVLALLATGDSNQAIADALGIGLVTVKSHVAAILSKLGVATRTAAANHAFRQGLASSPSTLPGVSSPF